MGWYETLYGRPGHGVAPGAPPKKGAARFFEILGRDFGALLGANALCALLCLAAALLLSLGVVLQQLALAVVCGALAGGLLGPAFWLLSSCVLRSLRDDPAPWLPAAWGGLKRHARPVLALGALSAVPLALALFFVEFLSTAAAGGLLPALPVVVFFALDALLLALALGLLWAAAPLALPRGGGLAAVGQGALRLLWAAPVRSLGAAALLLACFAAGLVFYPVSLLWWAVVGFWLPVLLAWMLLYPALSAVYSIERCAPHTPFDPPAGADARPLSPAEQRRRRAANWWYYHWGMVAAAALFLMGCLYVGHTLLTAVEPDESIALVTAEALPDSALAALEDALAAREPDHNGDGQVLVEVNNYTWSASPTDADAQTAGAVRITNDLAQGLSAVWLIEDPEGFEAAFGALSEIYGDAWRDAAQDGGAFGQEGCAAFLLGEETPLWRACLP